MIDRDAGAAPARIESWRPTAGPAETRSADLDALADILHAVVHDGAGVSFVVPFSRDEARAFWVHRVLPGVRAGSRRVLLARLDGRQPPLDDYAEGRAALAALTGDGGLGGTTAALERVRARDPRLAAQLEPMLRVTLAPTMIRASSKENVIPSRCTVLVDCRVPPGMEADHVRGRVEALLGSERDGGYTLEFSEDIVGNSSPLDGPLADAVRTFVERVDPGASIVPLVLPGFSDSHWFRKAFPECIAYGFFPQRAMSFFETAPLIHAPDERIALDDVALAASFFRDLAVELLV